MTQQYNERRLNILKKKLDETIQSMEKLKILYNKKYNGESKKQTQSTKTHKISTNRNNKAGSTTPTNTSSTIKMTYTSTQPILPTPPPYIASLSNRHCFYLGDERSSLEFTATIDINKDPRESYDQNYRSPTNIHLGQRKLLLSEIQLLNHYYKSNNASTSPEPTVLYIGAATGSHLMTLSRMFPKVKFILYDGAQFDPNLKNFPNIFEINEGENGFFTTELCEKIKNKLPKPLLFVSDIRLTTVDSRLFYKDKKLEDDVTRDMALQRTWVEILQPVLSLFKFRIPYNLKKGELFEYCDGTLLYGIWPKPLSGETRLLVEQQQIQRIKQYDFTKYEEVMFFHNKYRRPYCFVDKYKKIINRRNNTYCPCYDCIAELNVLEEYCDIMRIDFEKFVNTFASMTNFSKRPTFQENHTANTKYNLPFKRLPQTR